MLVLLWRAQVLELTVFMVNGVGAGSSLGNFLIGRCGSFQANEFSSIAALMMLWFGWNFLPKFDWILIGLNLFFIGLPANWWVPSFTSQGV